MKTGTVKLKIDMALLRELKDQLEVERGERVAAENALAIERAELARMRAGREVNRMAFGKALRNITELRAKYDEAARERDQIGALSRQLKAEIDRLRDQADVDRAAGVEILRQFGMHRPDIRAFVEAFDKGFRSTEVPF